MPKLADALYAGNKPSPGRVLHSKVTIRVTCNRTRQIVETVVAVAELTGTDDDAVAVCHEKLQIMLHKIGLASDPEPEEDPEAQTEDPEDGEASQVEDSRDSPQPEEEIS